MNAGKVSEQVPAVPRRHPPLPPICDGSSSDVMSTRNVNDYSTNVSAPLGHVYTDSPHSTFITHSSSAAKHEVLLPNAESACDTTSALAENHCAPSPAIKETHEANAEVEEELHRSYGPLGSAQEAPSVPVVSNGIAPVATPLPSSSNSLHVLCEGETEESQDEGQPQPQQHHEHQEGEEGRLEEAILHRSNVSPYEGTSPSMTSPQSLEADLANDNRVKVPYEIDRETFDIPKTCCDDAENGEWEPGKPLRVAYVTWNMANRSPRMEEIATSCIHPNAHIIIVGTQENGPYVGNNKAQQQWARAVINTCLGEGYRLVRKKHMWALHLMVFARSRDVAEYISHVHSGAVRTGSMGGAGGNKGGIAVALAISLLPPSRVLHAMQMHSNSLHAGEAHSALKDSSSTTQGDNSSNVVLIDALNRAAATPTTAATHPFTVGNDMDTNTTSGGEEGGGGAEGQEVADELARRQVRFSTQQDTMGTELTGGYDTGHHHRHRHVRYGRMFRTPSSLLPDRTFDTTSSSQQPPPPVFSSSESVPNAAMGSRNTSGEDGVLLDEKDLESETSAQYLTLLCINAHLAAHQEAVESRNSDYRDIVRGLQVGSRGKYRAFYRALMRFHRHHYGVHHRRARGTQAARTARNPMAPPLGLEDSTSALDTSSSKLDLLPLPFSTVARSPPHTLPSPSSASSVKRDVTSEFDLTLFGGDLNYRINGSRATVEHIVEERKHIRSILINNDQLNIERAKGTVFHGFEEGTLHFRPTYKYEVSEEGVTLDQYNFSAKMRMPAYCDRVLYKLRRGSSIKKVAIRLYTDVPAVRTSDHRPVFALFDVDTRAYRGSAAAISAERNKLTEPSKNLSRYGMCR